MKYVTEEDIERYKRQCGEVDLVRLVNFFCEGAVTTLSNFLYEHIEENGRILELGLADGCRCGSCREWQIIEDGKTVASAETMANWVEQIRRKA